MILHRRIKIKATALYLFYELMAQSNHVKLKRIKLMKVSGLDVHKDTI